MTAVRTLRRGRLARAVLLIAIAVLIPLPVAAGDREDSTKIKDVQPLISTTLARDLATTVAPGSGEFGALSRASDPRAPLSSVIARQLVPARSMRRSAQSTPGADSPTFFKTPAGVAVAAVMIVGVAYAIYSAQHDRITSPGKK